MAGSHELSAVAKLYELYEEHDFDVIVLDTPPSRNALDFLEAPGRLLGFLEGRALQVFLAPGGLTARLFGRGTALVFAIFARVTGVDMLGELSRFFRSLSGMTRRLRRAHPRRPGTASLQGDRLPDRDLTGAGAGPRGRASWPGRLADTGLPTPELIVNRVHLHGLDGHSAEELAELISPALGSDLARRVAVQPCRLRCAGETRPGDDRGAIGDTRRQRRRSVVGHLDEEVQDLVGLARIAEQLQL